MGEAGGAEVLANLVGQRTVLAEHHAAGERALRRRHPIGQRLLRATADTVERAEHAAAAHARRADLRRHQHGMRPTQAFVAVAPAQRSQPSVEPNHRSGRACRGRPRHARRSLDEHSFAAQARGGDPRAEGPQPRMLE